MRTNYRRMLDVTLDILHRGSYHTQQKTVDFKLSMERMEAVQVFLPEDVRAIGERTDFACVPLPGKCEYSCENADSFSLAIRRYSDFPQFFAEKDAKEILVLNMANPVHPGGGVRFGARAQEEDLCRRSSLLLSLESEGARKYYEYNRSLDSDLGSDGMILSPEVEVFRDEKGELLPETSIVAVLTCAAPIFTWGLNGLSHEEYQEIFYRRILGLLNCAAFLGYKVLVLGAWGCGAFGNDAKMVSDLFYKALKNMKLNGMDSNDLFQHIDFAVLSRSSNQYNFNEFARNFASGNFIETKMEAQA